MIPHIPTVAARQAFAVFGDPAEDRRRSEPSQPECRIEWTGNVKVYVPVKPRKS